MNNKVLITTLKIITIPTAYAIVLRLVFGVSDWMELFSVMSITFLFCLPTIMGMMTIYFSSVEKVSKLAYRIFFPWLPILFFMAITLAIAWEGWACWLMVLPLFLIAASIGGLVGGYYKFKAKETKIYISVLALLPLIISPIEGMIGSIPGTYRAYTSIDIKAPAAKIWANVTRVQTIEVEQDNGLFTKGGFQDQ